MNKIITIAFFILSLVTAQAQYSGHHAGGALGLRAGSQAPPGWIITQSLGLNRLDKIVDRFGHELGPPYSNIALNTTVLVLSGMWITHWRLFGANYAMILAFPFVNTVIELDSLDLRPKFGLSDIYFQPLNLGWHWTHVDAIFGAGMYIPTGRWVNGEKGNYGLGMWTYELEAAGTLYPGKDRMWNIASALVFEINSEKKSSRIDVGDVATLEGGIGHYFLGKRLNAGISYGAQWKLSHDRVDSTTLPGKNQLFTLGPEASYAFSLHRKPFLILTLRWLHDLNGEATVMGNRWKLLCSFPFFSRSGQKR